MSDAVTGTNDQTTAANTHPDVADHKNSGSSGDHAEHHDSGTAGQSKLQDDGSWMHATLQGAANLWGSFRNGLSGAADDVQIVSGDVKGALDKLWTSNDSGTGTTVAAAETNAGPTIGAGTTVPIDSNQGSNGQPTAKTNDWGWFLNADMNSGASGIQSATDWFTDPATQAPVVPVSDKQIATPPDLAEAPAKPAHADTMGTTGDRQHTPADTRGANGSGHVEVKDGAVIDDGTTQHGQHVHAEVTKAGTNVQVGDIKVDTTKEGARHYESKDWVADTKDGKGTFRNKETGQVVEYDHGQFTAKDRDGNIVAHGDAQHFTEQLKDIELRVVQPGRNVKQETQQAASDHDGDDKTVVIRGAGPNGDIGLANKDYELVWHRSQHWGEIDDRHGHVVHIRRGDDHKLHFYRVVDGKEQEQEMSQEERHQLMQASRLNLRHDGIEHNGRQLINSELQAKPTESSQINVRAGTVDAKDTHGQNVHVGDTPSGQTTVTGNNQQWTQGQGLQTRGSDGSTVNFGPTGVQIQEADRTTTTFNNNGSVQMTDAFGGNIWSADDQGNQTFWDGTQTNANGDVWNDNTGYSDSAWNGADGSYTSGDAAAGGAAAGAVDAADGAVGLANTEIADGLVMPDAEGSLDAAYSQLQAALDQCLTTGNYSGAAQVVNEMGVVASMRASIQPSVQVANEMTGDGKSTSEIAQAQSLSGMTPEQQVAAAEGREQTA